MADYIGPLKGQDPPDFGKHPVKTDQHTDAAVTDLKHGQTEITRREVIFLVHEKV